MSALDIASLVGPSISIGIAIWFPFKLRSLDREFRRDDERRDREWAEERAQRDRRWAARS